MTQSTSPGTLVGYWQEQVTVWRVSSQSQQAFCNTNDLSYRQGEPRIKKALD